MQNTAKENTFMGFEYNYKPTAFTPDDSARGLLYFLLFQTVISMFYSVLALFEVELGVVAYLFNFLLDACFVLGVYVGTKNGKKQFLNNLKISRDFNIAQIGLCLLLSLVCIFGFSGVTNVFLELLYSFGYNSVTSDIVIPNFGMYLVYVVFICILPAICEEIMFRGLIFNGLKRISTNFAVFGSAFLFMIMHGSPDQTVHQFILGIVLAISLLLTNNLVIPMFIHFFNNFIAVTYTYIAYGDSVAADTGATEIYFTQYLIYAVITFAVACLIAGVIFSAFVKIRKKKEAEKAVGQSYEEVQVVKADTNANINFYTGTNSFSASENAPQPEGAESMPDLTQNRLSTSGKVMYALTITWLAIEWISALATGMGLVTI